MSYVFDVLRTWILYPFLLIVAVTIGYAVSGLVQLMVSQYFSQLGELKCPPVPSFFWGHLQLLHDAENTNLHIKWMEGLGSIFTYRGFIGGYRLVAMDPRAIMHILSKPHEYPKPGFVRDTLATMAGEQGLLVVENETHRRQRKILNPAFTQSQVRELAPIFYEKAYKLRDIWLTRIDNAVSEIASPIVAVSHESLLSPSRPILPLSPPGSRSSFPSDLRNRSVYRRILPCLSSESTGDLETPEALTHNRTESAYTDFAGIRVDVLNWLGRATLDVIGLAGFGYAFDSLVDDQNILAAAFAEVFSAARKFRFINVLQAWFPILYYFRASRKSNDHSLRTMREIGMGLINRAQTLIMQTEKVDEDLDFREQDKQPSSGSSPSSFSPPSEDALKGRDLLSLLIKSNLATSTKDRMSQDEILSQMSTFMVAGHETTSSALAWGLYALSLHPQYQRDLRAEILSVNENAPSPETIQSLPYLDMVVRESLRLYSPVSQTMRVATRTDSIPVSAPYFDKNGRSRTEITLKKGDIISIPMQAMNKCKSLFGPDAEKFNPRRWEKPPEAMPTMYSGILTFLHGGRACIGYRFALLEMKIFLFVLLRSISFKLCPGLVIEKRLNVVTRPLVKSEPERGNQMPLLLSRASLDSFSVPTYPTTPHQT
ncbi:hypothetical protein M422DRAFT_24767 [Sphaerobolus stellatus SS14]|nr:hypothetical protein M422DRAFT_24767 [Sphaerobolus stellatus SS14]